MTSHLIAVVMFGATWAPQEPAVADATGDVEQPADVSDTTAQPTEASAPVPAEPEVAAAPDPDAAPVEAPIEAPVSGGQAVAAEPDDRPAPPQPEYGPFFEAEPVSDSVFATPSRKRKTPVLSVGNGAFCFVNDTHCKSSLILSAGVAAGLRVPASDAGPDIPYAQFSFVGGMVIRPLMLSSRRDWHPWGVGVVGSWSRGTGSVTMSDDGNDETKRTDAWRVAALNQIWLSKKNYGVHLDLTFGGVRSDVLTSGYALWGTHAEVAFGWGGWGELFAAADFLDRDSRVYFGLRGHGIAAGPVIGLILAGLALGGAM